MRAALFVRGYTLKRVVRTADQDQAKPADVEARTEGHAKLATGATNVLAESGDVDAATEGINHDGKDEGSRA